MDAAPSPNGRSAPLEVASVPIPTPTGSSAPARSRASGHVHLALVFGEIGDGESLLTPGALRMPDRRRPRLAPLRLRVQLRSALRTVAAEGRGIVLYVNGHEGRGIGLVNKLRAYVEQDAGADTIDANLRLGLHADLRDYGDPAAVLQSLGVRSVRLLSNNPGKAAARPAAARGRGRGAAAARRRPQPAQPRLPGDEAGAVRAPPAGRAGTGRGPRRADRHRQPARLAAPARRPAQRGAQVRPDAGRADRHPDRRREVDQRRGGTAGGARDAGRLRRRPRRGPDPAAGRPAAHRAHGPGGLAAARRPGLDAAHAADREGAVRRRRHR